LTRLDACGHTRRCLYETF